MDTERAMRTAEKMVTIKDRQRQVGNYGIPNHVHTVTTNLATAMECLRKDHHCYYLNNN